MDIQTEPLDAYMVTWQVELEFGGMTTVCLQRAAAFAERYGHASVVTFNADPAYEVVLQSLRERGKLSEKVRHVNFYEHLAAHPLKPQAKLATARFVPEHTGFRAAFSNTYLGSDTATFSEQSYAGPEKEVERKSYFRRNGTVYLTDTKFPSGGTERRLLEVVNESGAVTARFSSAAALYRYWLSELVDHEHSLVVVDSKFSAKFLSAWNTVHVPKLFAFHSTHVKAGQNLLTGALADGHAPMIEHRAKWDGFVFLTEAQRSAYVARFGDAERTFVVPNPVRSGHIDPPLPQRNPAHLIAAGSLTVNKNVAASIKVVAELKKRGLEATLNVVGQGSQLNALEQLASDLEIRDNIVFHGYSDQLPRHFAASAIHLLTSTNEGQALVLIESQQQGCVPVSYDINFGPADSITDGHNGFIVPHGDITAMADKAEALIRDQELAARMSANARKFAEDWANRDIVALWIKTRDEAARLKKSGSPEQLAAFTADLQGMDFLDGSVKIRFAHGVPAPVTGQFELVLIGRDSKEVLASIPASEVAAENAAFTVSTEILAQPGVADAIGDASVKFSNGSSSETKRLRLADPVLVPYLTAYNNLSIKRV